MPREPLALPITHLLRDTPTIAPEDSLIRAAQSLRQTAYGLVPVAEEGIVLGVVTEKSLLAAMANGASGESAATVAMVQPEAVLPPFGTGFEAMRSFETTGLSELLVVDGSGRLLGVIAPSDLWDDSDDTLHPGTVGGMATPFGVYLTNGAIRAGAGDLALVTTGAILCLMAVGGLFLTDALMPLTVNGPDWLAFGVYNVLPIAVFIGGMRAIPLSGIHAAEHMVVHAIERGEPLTPTVVKRMSRVHPRCGTNLAVAATLFLTISQAGWVPSTDLQVLIALLITVFFWRPLGSLVQLYVTTKPPSDKHVQMGIAAGKDMLDKYRATRRQQAPPLQRIWASGMLHVMAGSMLVVLILQGIAALFKFRLPI